MPSIVGIGDSGGGDIANEPRARRGAVAQRRRVSVFVDTSASQP